jgi:hypothetical protein
MFEDDIKPASDGNAGVKVPVPLVEFFRDSPVGGVDVLREFFRPRPDGGAWEFTELFRPRFAPAIGGVVAFPALGILASVLALIWSSDSGSS